MTIFEFKEYPFRHGLLSIGEDLKVWLLVVPNHRRMNKYCPVGVQQILNDLCGA